MSGVFLFSGTSEGRTLAAWLAENKIQCTVSVATEYGRLVMEDSPYITLLEGRMNRDEMIGQLEKISPVCVVDATHPFATEVTSKIQAACEITKIPYYRVSRDLGDGDFGKQEAGGFDKKEKNAYPGEKVRVFSTMKEAAYYLEHKEGNIFLTTGSKQLGEFVKICQDTERIFTRVLPSIESLELCEKAGLSGKHVIAMQGPFSKEMNVEMIKQVQATYMVTKETGAAGGFWEKIQAAEECGCQIIILENPEKRESLTTKYTVDQVKNKLCKLLNIENKNIQKKKIERADIDCNAFQYPSDENRGDDAKQEKTQLTLVGIGMGLEDTLTIAADKALRRSEVIFGAPRLLKDVKRYGKEVVPLYKKEDILAYLKEHPQYRNVVVALSGDTGFYSGAAGFFRDSAELDRGADELDRGSAGLDRGSAGLDRGSAGLDRGSAELSAEEKIWNVRILPGISSVSYFASRLQKSWQNWTLLSAHGRFCDIASQVRQKGTCFVLMDDVAAVKKLGETLLSEFGETVSVSYGYQLSYPEEEVRTGTPKMLQEIPCEQSGLYVILIERGIR